MDDELFAGFSEMEEIRDTRYASKELIPVPGGTIETKQYTMRVAKETGDKVEKFLDGYREKDKAKIVSILLERGLNDLPERKENGERIFYYTA